MCSYGAQWALAPNFFSLRLQNLSFFIKKLFPRQAGFHRFGVLNSLQVFLEHSLLERINYTPCWTKHFSVPCHLPGFILEISE